MPEPGLKIIAKLLLLKKYSTSNLNEILFVITHARKTDFFAFAHARKFVPQEEFWDCGSNSGDLFDISAQLNFNAAFKGHVCACVEN